MDADPNRPWLTIDGKPICVNCGGPRHRNSAQRCKSCYNNLVNIRVLMVLLCKLGVAQKRDGGMFRIKSDAAAKEFLDNPPEWWPDMEKAILRGDEDAAKRLGLIPK